MSAFGFWRRWKERRRERKQLLHVRDLASGWRLLERMFMTGMLTFDEKANRLFIAQPFAVMMMAGGADGWVNSVRNIYLYTYWRRSREAWEAFLRQEELAAVRKAVREAGQVRLSSDDIARIKRARRWEVSVSDMKAPAVNPFEFFIIPDSTAGVQEPVAVGYYNPSDGEMEIAAWQDVKPYLRQH